MVAPLLPAAYRQQSDAESSLSSRCIWRAVLIYGTLVYRGLIHFRITTEVPEPSFLPPYDVANGEYPAADAGGEAAPHARVPSAR